MEDDCQSRASGGKKSRKQIFIRSKTEAKGSSCSPEYIRRRSVKKRWTATHVTKADKAEKSLKNKDVRIKRNIARELFPTEKQSPKHDRGITSAGVAVNTLKMSGWYSDDEGDRLEDKNDEQHQIEGYSSENDKDSLFGTSIGQELVGDWFKYDGTSNHKMVLYQGQRFRDVNQFRKAVRVFTIREGFNLCVMENQSHIVCCECSDLHCDWLIEAVRVQKGMTFVVTDFRPFHECNRLPKHFQLRTKWIAAKYLHRWKQQPDITATEIRDDIKATYGVICPEWKLYCAANQAKHLLGMDHEDGYAMLNQFKEEMERVDRHNIVVIETDGPESGEGQTFSRMFVCCERTSYAFKNHCRGLLAVDGWKIDHRYHSVMLVAAALDGNNGILPVAFCEVGVEDLDSWVYFLKHLNSALHLDCGKGVCILGDRENGMDYAVEEYLPRATYRQCCRKVFSEMVKRFPTVPVQHLYWSACRSTTATAFYKYMHLISRESQECHDWLLQTNWASWALFSMPSWVKCTCVTLTITDKLRNYLHPYLEMSITRRFTGIVRLTAGIFEQRRMEVWKWYREKVMPTVRDIISDRCIDGQRFDLVHQDGTIIKLTTATSRFLT